MSRNNKKVVLVTGGTGLVGKGIEDFIASGAFLRVPCASTRCVHTLHDYGHRRL